MNFLSETPSWSEILGTFSHLWLAPGHCSQNVRKVWTILSQLTFDILAHLSLNQSEDKAPYFTDCNLPSLVLGKTLHNVVLRCSAKGTPKPEITWYKNYNPINNTNTKYKFVKQTLVIQDLQSEDNGFYKCSVCNNVSCIYHTYNLLVGKFVKIALHRR